MNLFFSLLATLLVYASAETAVDLGDASKYTLLAASAVTVTTSSVFGDVGIYPTCCAAIVGFLPNRVPAPDNANTAALNGQSALTTAFNAAMAKTPTQTLLSTFGTGGLTLTPGVYKIDAAAVLSGTVTLDAQGDPEAKWTFQVGSAMTFDVGSRYVCMRVYVCMCMCVCMYVCIHVCI
jgi:hypothetical protein